MLLVDARRERLTIDSKRRSTTKENNTTKAFGAGSIDWPELHTSNQARGQPNCSTERRLYWFNERDREDQQSECRVSIRIDPPLHHILNKRHSEIADKQEGNTAAVRHDCISV